MFNVFLKVFSSNFIVLILKLVSGFLFPKWMTTSEYASYQLFLLYISYIGILHLGFPTGMYINYAGIPYNQIEKKHFKKEIEILIAILAFFSCVFFAAFLVTKKVLILEIGLCILPYCFVTAFQSLYQAWGEFGTFSKLNVILSAVPIILALAISIVTHAFYSINYIIAFEVAYLFAFIQILYSIRKDLRIRSGEKVFCIQNSNTLKFGFSVCVGNYINVLFHSVDKQFVAWLFSEQQFAQYSFGLSLQNLMMIFITSLAQPMINFLAVGKVNKDNFKHIKSILLAFGGLSGAAYFACLLIVKNFLPKYAASMEITRVYFWTFPAMAMINCIYINLYRWKKKTKRYIVTLSEMLATAIVLNAVLTFIFKKAIAITFATAFVYAIWLILCSHDFKDFKLVVRDWIFLIVYTFIYFVSTSAGNLWVGALAYTTSYGILICLIYSSTGKWILHEFVGGKHAE